MLRFMLGLTLPLSMLFTIYLMIPLDADAKITSVDVDYYHYKKAKKKKQYVEPRAISQTPVYTYYKRGDFDDYGESDIAHIIYWYAPFKKACEEVNRLNGSSTYSYTFWNPSGLKILQEKSFKRFRKETEWYSSGQKKWEKTHFYKNLNGFDEREITWYENGQRESEIWQNSRGAKQVKHWYEDGELVIQNKEKLNYKNGQKHLICKTKSSSYTCITYSLTGKKVKETQYKSSRKQIKEGVEIAWYQNGKKRYEAHYQNNQKSGSYIAWYDTGQKKLNKVYKSDKKQISQSTLEQRWNPLGVLTYKEEDFNHYHTKINRHYHYYQNGNLKSKSEIKISSEPPLPNPLYYSTCQYSVDGIPQSCSKGHYD